jgi:hypothetical protein
MKEMLNKTFQRKGADNLEDFPKDCSPDIQFTTAPGHALKKEVVIQTAEGLSKTFEILLIPLKLGSKNLSGAFLR